MRWCEYDETTGRILGTGIGFSGMGESNFTNTDNKRLFDIPEGVDVHTHYIIDGSFVAFPDRPDKYYQWDWVSLSWIPNVIAAKYIARKERDSLLGSCDWTQLPDVPIETRELWLEYRQALRDITLQEDLFNIVWPIKPV